MARSRLIVLASIAGLFVWLFANALFHGGVFVFRDAGHYYYPLFQFVAGEWKAGRVPLWNPYENLGVPLAGNATSSVFYPCTLIFLLPLDYAWTYKLYVMGHVLLAAGAAYRLGRHWGGSVEAAGVGAMSYAFCGNVLFQYCNAVFLVGAAWLPLAVLAADRMLSEGRGTRGEGRVRWAVAFGVVLALVTLGGNAELAYHAALIATMYALWLWWHERRAKAEFTCPAPGLARSRPALLALAGGVGLTLSAIQVLPSVEFSRLSARATSPIARSVYEVPGHALCGEPAFSKHGTGWADGLLCRRLEPGTHHEHIYHFSVGPWRLAEYVWPNVGGRQFAVHRRWLEVIPAEGRIWVPSFYMGLVPLVLALGAMRLRRGSPRESWLSWLVLVSVIASFGWYGLGWLIQEIRLGAGAEPRGAWVVGAPFGGLYWLMTVLLPGYVYFRYPAKLLVIAALGLSMLAARGWDRAFDQPTARLPRCLLWLGGASLLGAAGVLAVFPLWDDWLADVPPDILFGPLDTTGAAKDLLSALLQTAVVCGAAWWVLRRADRGARWPASAALVLVAVDLAVANGWMVVCAPAGEWQKELRLAAVLQTKEARSAEDRPWRVFRRPIWMPRSWRASSSPTRLVEAMQWDRDTLWPKYNLPAEIPLAEVEGTMKPYDYQVFLWVLKRSSTEAGQGGLPTRSGLDAVNAKYVIGGGEDRMPGLEPVDLDRTESKAMEDVSLWHNPHHLPRAWIVHQLDVLPPAASSDFSELWRRTRDVFFPEGYRRHLRHFAVVETDSDPPGEWSPFAVMNAPGGAGGQAGPGARSVLSPQSATEGEICRVARHDPLCVQIEAELSRPGLVVLSDQFYPGWRLKVETAGKGKRDVPILRTNRVMRGAWLPAGRHRLTYRYRPASFLWGAAISGAGWLGLGGMAVGMARRRKRGRGR